MVFGPNFFFHPSFVRVRASFVLSTIVDMCNRSFYTMYNYIHTNTYTHNPVTVTAGDRRPETGDRRVSIRPDFVLLFQINYSRSIFSLRKKPQSGRDEQRTKHKSISTRWTLRKYFSHFSTRVLFLDGLSSSCCYSPSYHSFNQIYPRSFNK